MDASFIPKPIQDQNRLNTDAPTHTGSGTRTQLEHEEVMRFPTKCSNCQKPAELTMAVTNIPHFKEIILMSMVCEYCGQKTSETKVGGGIPDFGSRITLKVKRPDDLNREVVKSDTASIFVPEIELELAEGGLGGFYTTVEGLMVKLLESLQMSNLLGSGIGGDDTVLGKSKNERYQAFLKKLQSFAKGEILPFTVVITDPLGNSFISPPPNGEMAFQTNCKVEEEGTQASHAGYVDSGITVEHYQRSHEQNEVLGLNDLNVATENLSNKNMQHLQTER